MLNVQALRAEWVKNGLFQKDIAKKLGITEKTLCSRLKRGVLRSNEIEILIRELNISNPMTIFFNVK